MVDVPVATIASAGILTTLKAGPKARDY